MLVVDKESAMNVLLVEDNPGDVRLTCEALKDAKAQVGRARVITALQTVRSESEAGGSDEAGEVAR